MKLIDRLRMIDKWKGDPFVHDGSEPEDESFSVKFWNEANASVALAAMLEERLIMKGQFGNAGRKLIVNDFTIVVLNDLWRGGVTSGEFINADLYILGQDNIVVVISHDATPAVPDFEAENGTARHVGYDQDGRCCFLHFTMSSKS